MSMFRNTGFYYQGCGWYISNTQLTAHRKGQLCSKALGPERTVEDPVTITDVPTCTFPDRWSHLFLYNRLLLQLQSLAGLEAGMGGTGETNRRDAVVWIWKTHRA